MNEIPYPLKGDRLGRIIHLPFKGRVTDLQNKERDLRWFFLKRFPNDEWWGLPSSLLLHKQVDIDICAELYAVQHFSFDEADTTAKRWRKSHAKERFLMLLLWHTVEYDTLVHEEEDIYCAIENCHGIEVTEPKEKALVDRYPDLIKWTEYPGEVVLTRKGFESVRKYLPPVSSPIHSFTR